MRLDIKIEVRRRIGWDGMLVLGLGHFWVKVRSRIGIRSRVGVVLGLG